MRFNRFAVMLPFSQVTDGGGGGGAPAGSPPAPAAPPAAPPGGSSSAPAPGAPAGAPPAPPPGFTYKEDRSNWVPSHVVRQNTERARTLEQELAIERSRVAALSGVKPPAPPRNPQYDDIRNQMFEVAPELKDLIELKDKLKELTGLDLNEIRSIRESQSQSWVAHGNQTLRTLADKVKEAYGGADLSPKAVQRIARAFVAEVGEDPELQARYEGGDMTIIDEFLRDYTGGILDPYRRSGAAAAAPGQAAARRLPRGGGSSAVVGGRPPTMKPSDPGYHEAAYRAAQAGVR